MDFVYFKENYGLIAIDLNKKTKLKDPQQINFIGKVEEQNNGATIFFIIWKSEETIFEFFAKLWQYLMKIETQKIVNLLNSSENEYLKFATKKLYIIDSETKGGYSHHDPVKFLTKSIQSSLCDYSDAYVLVNGDFAVKILLI